MSLVLGVSRVNAQHRSCERPMYAYEIPGTVLIGYGSNLIEKGKWTKVPWDPRSLKVEDVVGVLIHEDGDMVIYVNQEQVLRVRTSLGDTDANETRQSLLDVESNAPASPIPASPISGASRARSPARGARKRNAPKRVLYPILDLHGRVCSVTLLPRQPPPNFPLQPRNKLP